MWSDKPYHITGESVPRKQKAIISGSKKISLWRTPKSFYLLKPNQGYIKSLNAFHLVFRAQTFLIPFLQRFVACQS